MNKILIQFFILIAFSFSAFATTAEHAVTEEASSTHMEETYKSQAMGDMVIGFLKSTGVSAILNPNPDELNSHGQEMSEFHKSWGRVLMILVTIFLF